MKKIIALILALSMCALCGCGGSSNETQASTTEAAVGTTEAPVVTEAPAVTEAPTEAPAEVYTNPLTGAVLDAPYTGRVFAVSINNLDHALPHRGVYKADIYLEMFVNHSIIRGLALYTDIASVESIGSVRSTRPIFSRVAAHYDAFMAHAGLGGITNTEIAALGVDHKNIDTGDQTDYSYRDQERLDGGYPYEDTLFAKGPGLLALAESMGVETTREAGKNYGMTFVEDGTPAGGEAASTVTISFLYSGSYKDTKMVYDADLGKYVYNQYGMAMADADTNEPEAFENVLVLLGEDHLDADGYHVFDFLGGGDGYFACNGQIIPIKWSCAGENEPLTYTTVDGQPLDLGVGSSYIGLAALGSKIAWE